MSPHNAHNINTILGHAPSAMLSLKPDEARVFRGQNIQGSRRISLPAKLSGTTEKENSDGRDTVESLNKSYSEMKNKLDELDQHNQHLEKQLSCIFSSISDSINKADKSYNYLKQNPENLGNILLEEVLGHQTLQTEKDNMTSDIEHLQKLDKTREIHILKPLKIKHGDVIEKQKIMQFLDEDQIKPLIPASRVLFSDNNRRKKPIVMTPVSVEIKQTKIKKSLMGNNNHNVNSVYEMNKENKPVIESRQNKCLKKKKTLFLEPKTKQRRVSSVDHRPFTMLSVVKEEEQARRISTGTQYEDASVTLSIGDKNKYAEKDTNVDEMISPPSPGACSSYSLDGSSSNDMESNKDLPQSPPELSNFFDESAIVDEFFLFSEDVLNADYDIVCQELANCSQDMDNLLENSSFLKAAKASEDWNTLWVYKGK